MAGGVIVPLTFEIYKGDQLLRTETLTQDIIKIGKLSSSHLRIDDEDVSRMHAVIEIMPPGEIHIIDLGSTKGTLVNGQKINKSKLASGDAIMLGDLKVVVTMGEPRRAADDARGRPAQASRADGDGHGAPRPVAAAAAGSRAACRCRPAARCSRRRPRRCSRLPPLTRARSRPAAPVLPPVAARPAFTGHAIDRGRSRSATARAPSKSWRCSRTPSSRCATSPTRSRATSPARPRA